MHLLDEPDLPSQINFRFALFKNPCPSYSILKWEILFLAKNFEKIRYDYLGKRAN
jgi:hypothetical protein